ncbi:MAG: hypothetical protein ACREV9_13365, partial [Burkholderiales bacterium]
MSKVQAAVITQNAKGKGMAGDASTRMARSNSAAVAPLIQPRDFFLFAYLSAATLVAWGVPEPLWPRVCEWWGRLGARGRAQTMQVRGIARILKGQPLAGEARRITAAHAANIHHSRLQYLRCYRFDDWHPRVRLAGHEQVEQALNAGRGAVIWIAPFDFSNLMPLVTAHRHGFKVIALSRTEHGISLTRFGARMFNPIFTSIEGRYLGERVVMPWGRSAGVLHELCRRVRENKIVAIRAISGPGHRTFVAPFLSGTLRIAAGSPIIALRAGAPLLPAFTIRHEDGSFSTTIEPPLHAAEGLGVQAA